MDPIEHRVVRACGAILAAVLLFGRNGALAQSTPVPVPSASATGSAPIAQPLPPAGAVPAAVTLDVTGVPIVDAGFLEAQIRAALDRRIRPTLRPGAGIVYGAFVPWPLLPVPSGARAAVNVAVTISGDGTSTPVAGVATVTIENLVVPRTSPALLFLSDDPEYLQSEGLVFRGTVTPERPARLYYYHSDIGVPRDLDVVLTANVPSRVLLVRSEAGPDLDVMSVGHAVSRDFLRFQQQNQGIVADVAPGTPFIVRHALILQGEVVAGAADLHVLKGGAVAVSVVGSPAGARPDAYLDGPRVAFDGHGRHGVFDLAGYGDMAASYTVGGQDAAVKYGARTPTPRNVDAGDTGHDYGDYGVVRRITFTLANPTDDVHRVYLYEKPLGGPVRSTFVVDGQLKELGCVRLPQPYWVTTYQLPAHTTGSSTTMTMTDGGSFYPLEFGVTEAQPMPFTPPIGAPDGCSRNVARLPDPPGRP